MAAEPSHHAEFSTSTHRIIGYCKVGYAVTYGKHLHKGVLADTDLIPSKSLCICPLYSSAMPPLCAHSTSDRHHHTFASCYSSLPIFPCLVQSVLFAIAPVIPLTLTHHHTIAIHTASPSSSSATFIGMVSPSTQPPLCTPQYILYSSGLLVHPLFSLFSNCTILILGHISPLCACFDLSCPLSSCFPFHP